MAGQEQVGVQHQTPEQKKAMRSELASIVLDLSYLIESSADKATREMLLKAGVGDDSELVRMLMKGAAIIAIQDVMLEVRKIAGRA